MKAKKPVLLFAFVLVLLVVALILPAAASGASGNTPVHWATWGSSTGSEVPGWQGVLAFNVRELSNESYKGFALFQSVRRYPPGAWDRASSFEAVRFGTVTSGDLAGFPCVTFVVQTEGKVWLEPGAPLPAGAWAKVYAVDTGPGGVDFVQMWFDTDPSHDHGIDADWSAAFFQIPLVPVNSNVEIH